MTRCKYFLIPADGSTVDDLDKFNSFTADLEIRVLHDNDPENARRVDRSTADYLFGKKYVDHDRDCAKWEAAHRGII